MTLTRRIVEDSNSELVAEIRRSHNELLWVLQNISTQVDAATITSTEGWVALGLTLAGGVDATVASINGGANTYTGTGVELASIKVSPRRPRQPKRVPLQAATVDDI
jgi:hypothetical protein